MPATARINKEMQLNNFVAVLAVCFPALSFVVSAMCSIGGSNSAVYNEAILIHRWSRTQALLSTVLSERLYLSTYTFDE